MLRPPYLQAGDKVALISPAGPISSGYIKQAEELLSSWGLIPVKGKHVDSCSGEFAGSDAERLEDIQWAMNEEDIHAIFCTTAGYGCLRLIEQIDYSLFQGNPKWLIGSREITVFHSQINELGVESLYAPMPISYASLTATALDRLKNILFGQLHPYKLQTGMITNPGIVESELAGGDLNIIHHLHATTIQHNLKSTVLFLDTTQTKLETERILRYMKLSKIFQQIRGLIICNDNTEDQELLQLIRDITEEFDYPVFLGLSSSDNHDNYPIILGSNVRLTVTENETEIQFV